MKFFVTNELKNNRSLKIIITLFLVCLTLFLWMDIYLKMHLFGFVLDDILSTVVGDMNYFIDPMSMNDKLELVHVHSFFALIYFALILGVMFRLSITFYMIMGSVLSLFISYISLFLVIWNNTFIYFFISGFILFNILFSFNIFNILLKLWFIKKQ